MGWGHGILNGKEIGYNVKAKCEYPGCDKEINRGLAYACGENHGEGEDFCDGYFCYDHLIMGGGKQRCPMCYAEWEKTPEGKAFNEAWNSYLTRKGAPHGDFDGNAWQ
jgi:hypothetical protein